MAEAEKILRTCVHCGFCTATCSTYVLLGDERDSPRGRIIPHEGHVRREPRRERRGHLPCRPLPVVPVLHDDMSERCRLHASCRPCARAYRGDAYALNQGTPDPQDADDGGSGPEALQPCLARSRAGQTLQEDFRRDRVERTERHAGVVEQRGTHRQAGGTGHVPGRGHAQETRRASDRAAHSSRCVHP